jgi:type III pantothenate kinase
MNDLTSDLLLAVDIGNNQIKLGLMPSECAGGLPVPSRVLKIATRDMSFDRLTDWLPPDKLCWCVGAVHRETEHRLADWVRVHQPNDLYVLLANHRLPIEICVDRPDQVGADRLLAAVAVNRLRATDRPAIVIDAGSAITVDLVSADGAFQGGAILPGLEMVATAMAEQTDLLPLVRYSMSDEPPPVLGRSTGAAIQSGLFWGTIGAVREIVGRLSSALESQPQLFLAGGDAAKLAPFLEETVQIVPELVLAGIALTYQNLRRHSPA